MQVFGSDGANLAQGKAITALDSIEAPPRWRKVNLTDGIAPEGHSRRTGRTFSGNAPPS
jgi:hypothetical protein